MLGKMGVSGVFIGGLRASPRSDGGVQIQNQGVWGSKIHSAYPTLNVGYPRVKGRKIAPSRPEWKRRKEPAVTQVHAKSVTVVKPPSGPVRSLKTIGCKLRFLHNANSPDLDEYSLAS